MASQPSSTPCLFCFSQANQSGGHQYQGSFDRIERCYRLLCNILGLKLDPNEDFISLFNKTPLPLCMSCSLVFSKLADLQEQVLRLQQSINEVGVEIQNKIRTSEQDGSLALAFAIQSIESNSAQRLGAAQTALLLSWIQNFRQRAISTSIGASAGHSTSSGTNPNLVLVGNSPVKYQVFGEYNQGLNEEPMTIFIGPDVITSDIIGEREPDGDVDQEDPDFDLNDCDDISRNDSDDSDYEPIPSKNQAKPKPVHSPLRNTPVKAGQIVQSITPDKTSFRLNCTPVNKPRKPKKRVRSSPVRRGRKKGVKTSTKLSSFKTSKKSQLGAKKHIDSTKRFKCHLCPQSFIRPYYLADHVTSHTGLNNFVCRLCPNAKFATLRHIQAHNQLHHGTSHPYGCMKCAYNASTNEQLNQHISSKHDLDITGPPYVCSKCNDGIEFASIHHLRRHMKSHLNARNYPCCFCPLQALRKDDLLKHMTKMHRTEPNTSNGASHFKCNMCPEAYPTSIDLITHYYGHGDKNSRFLNCKPCRVNFTTMFEYNIHNEEIHGDPFTRYPCSECDWVLHSELQLQRHLLLHDPKRQKNYVCQFCSKSFFKKFMYDKHVSVYHQDPSSAPIENYDCSECGKSYLRKVDMIRCAKRHKRVVNSQETTCHTCDKTFNIPYDLKRHVFMTHSEDCPERCSECPASFKLPSQLKKHEEMYHSEEAKAANRVYVHKERRRRTGCGEGEGSLMCEFCGRSCSTRQALRRHHLTVHSDNRPFLCSSCGKSFKRQDDLKKHKDRYCDAVMREKRVSKKKTTVEEDVKYVMNRLLKSVEKETKKHFPCEDCDEAFCTRSRLEQHVASAHSETMLYKCTKCEQQFCSTSDLIKHVRTGPCFTEDFNSTQVDVVEMALQMTEDSVGFLENTNTQPKPSTTRKMTRKSALRQSEAGTAKLEFLSDLTDDASNVDHADPDFTLEEAGDGVSDRESDSSPPRKNNKSSSTPNSISFKCPDCDLSFSSRMHLQRHKLSVHLTIRPYGCVACDKSFKRTDDLLKHHRKFCGTSLKKRPNSDREYKRKKIKKEVPDGLDYDDDRDSNLDASDIKESNSKTETTCEICNKQFSSSHSLQRHINTIHNDTRPFSCKRCFSTFKRRDDLLKHMRNNCKRESSNWSSDSDEETSRNISASKAVVGIPTQVKCELCGQIMSIQRINRHKETKHKGENPFRCVHCNESYNLLEDYLHHSVSGKCLRNKRKSTLEYPRVVYSREERLLREQYSDVLGNEEVAIVVSPLTASPQDEVKSQKFNTSVKLKKSQKSVSSKPVGPKSKRKKLEAGVPKNLTCGVCDKTFSSMAALNRHMLTIHSSDRPFQCEVCHFAFKRQDDKLKHRRKQHPNFVLIEEVTPRKKDIKEKLASLKEETVPSGDESSVGSSFEFGPNNSNDADSNWNTVVYIDESSLAGSECGYEISPAPNEDLSD